MKDIREDLNKHRDLLYPWIGKCDTVIWKLIYKFNVKPIKIPIFFMVLTKVILKCTWKNDGPRLANTILKKVIKMGELVPLDIKL